MNTNTKPRSSNTDAPQQLRDMTETGAQQTSEALEKISAATSQAANVMTDCCSRALKGMQDYNSKLIEFTQDNAKSQFEFLQKLAGVKKHADFLDLFQTHTRGQLERMGNQASQLGELTKQVLLATAEPVKTGLAKIYDRAA